MADQTNQNQRFNIDNFRSNIKASGYQKTTDFTLMINALPPALASVAQNNSSFREIMNELIFRVEMTTVPGVSMATQEIRRHGIGAFEMKPYVPVFAPLEISVLGDADGNIHDFFQTWMNATVNFNSSKGVDGATGIKSNQYWYEVAYKESYETDLTFVSYNKRGEEIIKINVLKAYPIFMAPVQMSWDSTNNLVRFPISFAYYDWYSEKNQSSINSNSPSNNSYVGPLIKAPQNLKPDGS